MRARTACVGLLLVALAAFSGPARGASAQPPRDAVRPVPIHAGRHRGYGRLVFDFRRWVGWRLERQGTVIHLTFSVHLPFGPAPKLPPNVLALTDGPGWADVTLAKGARARQLRVGARLVLDALDPAPPQPAVPLVSLRHGPPHALVPPAAVAGGGDGPAVGPGGGSVPDGHTPAAVAAHTTPSLATTTRATTGGATTGQATPHRAAARPFAGGDAGGAVSTPVAAAPPSLPVRPSTARALPVFGPPGPTGPVALAARPARKPRGSPGAILIPFEPGVSAAAFRRAGEGVVVFDRPRPIDVSALVGTPVFGTVRVHLLPAGTELLMKLPAAFRLTLRRRAAGWLIALSSRPPPRVSIRPVAAADGLHLPLEAPGRVVSLLDPETGATLLVGTQGGVAAGLPVTHRAPQFALLRSWRGVAIEALSDRLRLRPLPGAFLLSLAGGSLAISPGGPNAAAMDDAALLTKRFHFPDLPVVALAHQLRRELRDAAERPPLARGKPLRRAAATMIGLGMAAEAHALLHLAATEAPTEAVVPDHAGLAAIAALMTDDPQAAGAIDSPRLAGSDEVTLWRAVRVAEMHPRSSRAAQLFAATAPLALAYPRAMRRLLLPLAAETMIQGGAAAQATKLIALRPRDKRLSLARGMLDAAHGRIAAALAVYHRLAAGPDRLLRYRAAFRAVALELTTHAIGSAEAADRLDRLRDAWRGGKRELHLRETLAGLRADAGQWSRALTLLRHAIRDFPQARTALRSRMRRIFSAALADRRLDRAPPLHFVAFVNANADLLPKGKAGNPLAAKLADRLLALDLPDQAEPLLARLAHQASTAVARAGFGARLAALRLHQGSPAGAAAALTETAAPDLPANLALSRAILAARIDAAQGHAAAAQSALLGLNSTRADRAAAHIAEQAGDWSGAAAALTAQAARQVPVAGSLTPTQRQLLLRLATARVRAQDHAGIAALRLDQERMGTGALADMFRLLTSPGVHAQAQVARAGTIARLALGLGQALKAVR